MTVNLNMRGEEEGNINEYLLDTVSDVFASVYVLDVTGCTNRVAYAFDSEETMQVFRNNVARTKEEELASLMRHILLEMKRYEAGEHVMTDDRAPVELLSMRVIDSLIHDEVQYYKGIYEKDGLDGLLKQLL